MRRHRSPTDRSAGTKPELDTVYPPEWHCWMSGRWTWPLQPRRWHRGVTLSLTTWHPAVRKGSILSPFSSGLFLLQPFLPLMASVLSHFLKLCGLFPPFILSWQRLLNGSGLTVWFNSIAKVEMDWPPLTSRPSEVCFTPCGFSPTCGASLGASLLQVLTSISRCQTRRAVWCPAA